jgi:hypothetical protein
MKTATSFAMSVLFVAPLGLAALSGCAGDKNKQLDEAAAKQAEAARTARESQIEQSEKQEMKSIDANKQSIENAPQTSQQLAKAQANLVEERQKFQVEAQARLQKAQARLDEARTKMRIGRGNADVGVQNKLDETSRLAMSAAQQIDHLPQVSNDNWAAEKKRIDQQLTDIENGADDARSKADSAVP